MIQHLSIATVRIAAQPAPYRPFGGFRFMLAAMVLLQHGLLLLPLSSRFIFYRLELGAVAVTVFFALSGYVVAEAVTCFYAGRPLRFLANRVLRLVPLYSLALALAIGLDGWFYARGHLVTLDAPLQGPPWDAKVILGGLLDIVPGMAAHRLSGQSFSFIPFAWTLRVECAFYLAASLVCVLPQRRPSLTWACGLTYALFSIFLWRHAQLPQQLLCIPFFAFGVCAYRMEQGSRGAAAANLLAMSICAAIAFTFWAQRGHPDIAVQLPLLGLLLATLVWLGRHSAPRLARLDKQLGALSYPLYIGHGVILTAMVNITAQRSWQLYAVGMALSLGFAMALHAAVERPLRKIRARVRGIAI
jgi:peptidoglycan/LPS O-acetylase OafA/YrhL